MHGHDLVSFKDLTFISDINRKLCNSAVLQMPAVSLFVFILCSPIIVSFNITAIIDMIIYQFVADGVYTFQSLF